MEQENPASIVRSTTEIPTEHASRYLQQLCKHFAHKCPSTFNETAGQVTFSIGDLIAAADAAKLTLTVEAADEAQRDQLKDVAISHLVRFAFREELQVEWRDAA